MMQTVQATEKAGSECNLNIGVPGYWLRSLSHIRLFAFLHGYAHKFVADFLLFPCNKNLIR
jgi:hypothetical protein